MTDQINLSPLDHPLILQRLFPLYYSQFLRSQNIPFNSPDVPSYHIEVEPDINIKCGFWVSSKEAPTILYFHGNGETVAGHEWLAPFYNQRGINLFAADYRGYGSSNGYPTISNLVADAPIVFNSFKEIIEKEGFSKRVFVMGRSLGSIPAVEIAFSFQDEIKGFIIESGTANNFPHLLRQVGLNDKDPLLSEDSLFRNKIKIRQVQTPCLIIHGEIDELIPVREGKELYENSASRDKRLLIIPGAGHNDMMAVDTNLYFNTIDEFIKTHT